MSALVRSVRLAPSLRVSVQSLRSSRWLMLAVVLATGFALSAVLPHHASTAILNPMGGVIGVAAVAGLRRSDHKAAFNLLAAGVAAYAIADMAGLLSSSQEAAAFAFGLFLVAYMSMAAGLTVLVVPRADRHRHHRH